MLAWCSRSFTKAKCLAMQTPVVGCYILSIHTYVNDYVSRAFGSTACAFSAALKEGNGSDLVQVRVLKLFFLFMSKTCCSMNHSVDLQV